MRGSTSGARGVQAFDLLYLPSLARIEALLQAWFGAPTELGTYAWWDVRARSADTGAVP